MPYLIDGNNLIGQVSSYSLSDPRSRQEILGMLWLFQRATRKRLWVVFDGSPDTALEAECNRWEKFSVLFPGQGLKADDLIVQIINQSRHPRAIILVTSDRELRNRGRLSGAQVVGVQDFARQLKKVIKERKKQRELRKPSFHPSPLETKLWLETFQKK